MTAGDPQRAARVPPDLQVLGLVGLGGHALLYLGVVPPRWLLPAALLLLLGRGWRAARTLPARAPALATFAASLRAAQPAAQLRLLLVLVVVADVLAIAAGSVATLDRSWDGFATWSLTARHLLAGDGLHSPYFADPSVYHYARGYPLLQPILLQQTMAWLGPHGGRLLFPALWLMLVGSVGRALRAAGAAPAVRDLARLGTALVPLFGEPGGGSAESGFADLLLAMLLVHGAAAILTDSAALAALAAALLPLAKNEGAIEALLLLAAAAAAGRRRAALGAALACTASLAFWLPVQQQLLAPGAGTAADLRTFVPALGPGLAAGAGALLRRWPAALLLCAAAPFLATDLGGLRGSALAEAAGVLGRNDLDWSAVPAILGSLCRHFVWVRKFGLSFVLLLPLALLAWRRRGRDPERWRATAALLAVPLVLALLVVVFVATMPPPRLDLFLREGMARYLAQSLGVVWLTIGLVLDGLLAGPSSTSSPAPAAAAGPR